MAVDPQVFGIFAQKFRNHDPKTYDRFLEILAAWTHEVTVAVTQADPSNILNAQGRAQQQLKVLQVLSEYRDENGKIIK